MQKKIKNNCLTYFFNMLDLYVDLDSPKTIIIIKKTFSKLCPGGLKTLW